MTVYMVSSQFPSFFHVNIDCPLLRHSLQLEGEHNNFFLFYRMTTKVSWPTYIGNDQNTKSCFFLLHPQFVSYEISVGVKFKLFNLYGALCNSVALEGFPHTINVKCCFNVGVGVRQ